MSSLCLVFTKLPMNFIWWQFGWQECLINSITLWYYSLYDRIKLASLQTQISSCIYVPLGAKTISSHSHFENDSSPNISGSGSLIQIKIHYVLFKHVALIWIHYLETRSHWDNTSCYNSKDDIMGWNSWTAINSAVCDNSCNIWQQLQYLKKKNCPCFWQKL